MIPQTEEPPPKIPHVGDDDRPWCCRCGTNEYLCFESVTPVPDIFDMVDVDYLCTQCESFYGHLVPTIKMDKDVLKAFGIPYITTGMEGYLHCGEAMTPTGERMPSPHARLGPHHDSWQPPRRSPMKVVRCRCGFQMEVPLERRNK
ncbi:MAG: hypothetical protein ABI563_06995 [Specibacter sp.]